MVIVARTLTVPAFKPCLPEIEAGRVAVCCTKDLSRLGRNSSLTGLYINFTFPKYNVRYIAINDHFDTIDPNSTDSDIAGIKNWFNEFFAKDTSRKIRAVNKAKGPRRRQYLYMYAFLRMVFCRVQSILFSEMPYRAVHMEN